MDWTANQVELTWKEPVSDGGSPITGYIIEKKDKYSTMWEKALEIETPTTKGLVHGLIEGNDYVFRVIAVNKAGQSEPGDTSKTFTAKPRYREYLLVSFHALYRCIEFQQIWQPSNLSYSPATARFIPETKQARILAAIIVSRIVYIGRDTR